jgi:hypothetical protein
MMFVRGDCKKLSCKFCGPKRAERYRQAIAKRALEFGLKRFVTLTLDPGRITEGKDSVTYIRECFNKFRVYLGRDYGKIKYISVVEFQKKSGIAHLHVLVGSYIPQAWIKQAWMSCGGGWMVDIRQVDVHRIPQYLSKYLTKDLLNTCPKGKRRVTTSRGIVLFEIIKRGFKLIWIPIKGIADTTDFIIGECTFDEMGLKTFEAFET